MISRLYLGAHWLTDVIGSALLGTAILLLSIVSYRRMPIASSALQLSRTKLIFLLFIGLGLPWGVWIAKDYQKDERRSTPIWPDQLITSKSWWKSPLNDTPLYRNNRIGKPFQPFNVQWQGQLNTLELMLRSKGWQSVSQHPRFKTELKRFASYNAEDHMPLLPWLYQNKPPALLMIKPIPNRKMIIELRLWSSNIYFSDTGNPLWLGAIDVRLPPTALLSLKHEAEISMADGGGMIQFRKDTAQFHQRIIHVEQAPAIAKKLKSLDWDGEILLLKN